MIRTDHDQAIELTRRWSNNNEHSSARVKPIGESNSKKKQNSPSYKEVTKSRKATKSKGLRGLSKLFFATTSWHRTCLLTLVLVIPLLIAYSSYLYYVHLMETRILRPSNEPRVVPAMYNEEQDAAYHWGTYRPGVYFGLKTRRDRSPVFGAMWFSQRLVDNQLPIRHQCEMGEYDQRYTWLKHDGQNFGIQQIHDGEFVLNTSFAKRLGGRHGGDWTARFSLSPTIPGGRVSHPVSLLFYTALDGEGRLDARVADDGLQLEAIAGMTDATGPFQLTFHINDNSQKSSSKSNVLMHHHLITFAPGLDVLKEVVLSNLAYHVSEVNPKTRYIGLVGERLVDPRGSQNNGDTGSAARLPANFIVHQVTGMPPFEMDVCYESASVMDRPEALVREAFTETINRFALEFDKKFKETFPMQSSSNSEIDFAKAAFSNLVGGIGYFSGQSLVKGKRNKDPVAYFSTQLYTSVPSRSFFPRGFLWDEGFHNLLIGRFNTNITQDIVAHWLDTMNLDGWIPREQILDQESRARVPVEFVVQRDTNANPPTLFLPLEEIVQNSQRLRDARFLQHIFPRLRAWFDWFNRTQVGKLPGTYRWRGRREDADNSGDELNPITLTSGLDDYPRASHPTDDERHVDLRCWIAFAAGVLAKIAKVLEDEPAYAAYEATRLHLSDNKLLDELHWSSELQSYADYGLHSSKVKLVKMRQPLKHPPSGRQGQNAAGSLTNVRVFDEQPKLQFVDAEGYVSLFPFLLRILDPSSDKLGIILDRLKRIDLLWTDYGLRSLSKGSPLYRKNNRPDSPAYWRGAIWININYLAVEALAHYATVEGNHRQTSIVLYQELRKNLIRNMHKEYKRTGYIWEQYDDENGRGQRAHPFTGWSALVTLMMSDKLNDSA